MRTLHTQQSSMVWGAVSALGRVEEGPASGVTRRHGSERRSILDGTLWP